jgi:hypothetical protein
LFVNVASLSHRCELRAEVTGGDSRENCCNFSGAGSSEKEKRCILSFQEGFTISTLQSSEPKSEVEPGTASSLVLSGTSFISGVIQGACAVLVASSSLKILVGVAGLAAAMKSSKIHSDPVRVPLMAVATLLALVTLFVLWNGHRLRNLPSARWRKQSLSLKRKAAIAFSLLSAVMTLVLVVAELLIHPIGSH